MANILGPPNLSFAVAPASDGVGPYDISGAQPRPAAAEPSDAEPSDAQFTSTATQLVALHAGLILEPSFDGSRVANIQAAIAAGTYRVVFTHVADQLIAMERQLPT